MPKDLLLEIGTEEIPARFMPGILAQLESISKAKFAELRIGFGELKAVGTPRRLALLVQEMAEMQSDKQTEAKGPSVKIAYNDAGEPTKAAQGFARSQGIDVSQLVQRDGYIYAVVNEVGHNVQELLPEILSNIILSLTFPKNMRWGNLEFRFVRPIRWLVSLFGSEIIPLSIAEVTSSNITYGHRVLSKATIVLHSVSDYFTKLAEGHVMVDQTVRKQVIREQIEKIATSQGGTATIDKDLLEEVVYLVEYPTALYGKFDEKYLALPPEAIMTPMREHQRYFPVVSNAGNLLPLFITVRDGGLDYIDVVRHGNERVLKARLDDAKFFFEEDQKVSLADRVEKLNKIVFQEGLGTLLDKVKRLEELSLYIASLVDCESNMLPLVRRGAHLSKADLLTGMVYEFTELQGTMGREYARINGEDSLVAEAIFEHYLPRFAGDILPSAIAGRVISIADKLDNIVATFSRGLIPSGSQDPYALRRQALGIVNILIDANYHVSLTALLTKSMDLLNITDASKREQLINSIQEFFRLRIKNVLQDNHLRYDIVDAVMAVETDDLYDTWLKANALSSVNDADLQKIVQSFTRVGNLAKNAKDTEINPQYFINDAEQALYDAYVHIQKNVSDILSCKKDYAAALDEITKLSIPITAFFDAVMIMVDDETVKNNRLALLKALVDLARKFADFGKIVSP